MVPLVLDTNVLANLGFLQWLRENPRGAPLPAGAYMEAKSHALKRRRPIDWLDQGLEAAGISVVDFDREQAGAAAEAVIGRWDFAENARDYAIGALPKARKGLMVTENKKHFTWLPEGQ